MKNSVEINIVRKMFAAKLKAKEGSEGQRGSVGLGKFLKAVAHVKAITKTSKG